jgi:hypothetical protein
MDIGQLEEQKEVAASIPDLKILPKISVVNAIINTGAIIKITTVSRRSMVLKILRLG